MHSLITTCFPEDGKRGRCHSKGDLSVGKRLIQVITRESLKNRTIVQHMKSLEIIFSSSNRKKTNKLKNQHVFLDLPEK